MTLQGKNGQPIALEHTMYLQGEWEVCLSQLYYTKNSNSIYKDSFIRIIMMPTEKPESEHEASAWNNMLKRFPKPNEFRHMDITIRFPAGEYKEESLIQTLNKAIRNNEVMKKYYELSQYSLSNGMMAPNRKIPEFKGGYTRFLCVATC